MTIHSDTDVRMSLVAGVIARPNTSVMDLLQDLLDLAMDDRLASLEVVILPAAGDGDELLLGEVAEMRRRGLRVYCVRVGRLHPMLAQAFPTSHSNDLRPIAINRSIVQHCAGRIARIYRNPVCWILDGDTRLHSLAVNNGAIERTKPDYVGEILRLRAEGCPLAVGKIAGAAPLPRAMSVRTQLVDLMHLLARANTLNGATLLGASPTSYFGRSYHHDCTGHKFLEYPVGLNPLPESTKSDLLRNLPEMLNRILAGDAVTRPLIPDDARGKLHRGGNLLAFDVDALLQCPNGFAYGPVAAARRQDEAFVLLNQLLWGRDTITGCFPVTQIRTDDLPTAPDIDRLREDIVGRAFLAGITCVMQTQPCPSPEQLVRVMGRGWETFVVAGERNAHQRLDELRASFYRIQGAAESMHAMLPSSLDSNPAPAKAHDILEAIPDQFSDTVWQRLAQQVNRRLEEVLTLAAAAPFPQFVRDFAAMTQADRDWTAWLSEERRANADSTLRRWYPTQPIELLGQGAEGTVYRVGDRAVKMLHGFTVRRDVPDPDFLPSLKRQWDTEEPVYPVLDWKLDHGDAAVMLPFEPTTDFGGGDHGTGWTELLAAMRRNRVIHSNVSPSNLRIHQDRVRLIDYGSDLRPYSDNGFDLMVRKAWLCRHWHFRSDMKELLTASLSSPTLPELQGYERMLEAAKRFGVRARPRDRALTAVLQLKPRRVLDFGCGGSKYPRILRRQGIQVASYDPKMRESAARKSAAAGVHVCTTLEELYHQPPFDVVLLSHVLCEVHSDTDLRECLAAVYRLVAPNGHVIVSMCGLDGEARETTTAVNLLPANPDFEQTCDYRKHIRSTGNIRRHVHRPESLIRREFARAGFAVSRREEFTDIDLARFEPCGGALQFQLTPLAPRPETTLVIRACAMDADTVAWHVRHLVRQLSYPRGFAEIILALDNKEEIFLREHCTGDLPKLVAESERLRRQGWVDTIVHAPDAANQIRALNQKWIGLNSDATHEVKGAPLTVVFAAFERCSTPYVLHVDADTMIGRTDAHHDYLGAMIAEMAERNGLTCALNLAGSSDSPMKESHAAPYRLNVRAALTNLTRLRQLLPLPNHLEGDLPTLAWHRSADAAIQDTGAVSLRGGHQGMWAMHPPNECKRDRQAWNIVVNRTEQGQFPVSHYRQVDWNGDATGWLPPKRNERFVFVVCGRDVPRGRIDRCLDSMLAQSRDDWGAVIMDDASRPGLADHLRNRVQSDGDRFTLFHRWAPAGGLANLEFAVRQLCGDRHSVIVTLDLDDALLGHDMLDRLAEAYDAGADVTVGTMLRTDKEARYPINFDQPHLQRGAGNVWQHPRSFRKYLFDALPESALRDDNGEYFWPAEDWAYMIPIALASRNPVAITHPMYLHEPRATRDLDYREARNSSVRQIIRRYTMHREQ